MGRTYEDYLHLSDEHRDKLVQIARELSIIRRSPEASIITQSDIHDILLIMRDTFGTDL